MGPMSLMDEGPVLNPSTNANQVEPNNLSVSWLEDPKKVIRAVAIQINIANMQRSMKFEH